MVPGRHFVHLAQIFAPLLYRRPWPQAAWAVRFRLGHSETLITLSAVPDGTVLW